MNRKQQHDNPERPTLADHPGLDNDEVTEEGRVMTAAGSTTFGDSDADGEADAGDKPTVENHPGLHDDEAMEAGKMMTALGSDSRRDPKVESLPDERS